jgi:hypothetical protein
MTRHYTTREFFRQMPNAFLARYFEAHGVLAELDFAAMKETRPDALFAAWLELPEGDRNRMDAEFREIAAMSCEKGFRAILDEAAWHFEGKPDERADFTEKLAALDDHCERAMVTFLDHANFWNGATLFNHADSLPYWRKRKGLPHVPASVHEAGRTALAGQIRDYFRLVEGRGNNCVVEAYRRGNFDYFFAYPEDYSQRNVEWVKGQFERRPHNPAFEVIFVYSKNEGTLDLNFRGSLKAVEPLQGMFATAILSLPELPPDPGDSRIYDLNPLRGRAFQFIYEPKSGIQSVAVKKLRLSSKVVRGDRITVEADASSNAEAIYDLLDKVGRSVPLRLYNVTQAELAALVAVETDKPSKSETFRITYPNSCSLKYDDVDLKLRQMLADSGIEPREPTEGLELNETEIAEA